MGHWEHILDVLIYLWFFSCVFYFYVLCLQFIGMFLVLFVFKSYRRLYDFIIFISLFFVMDWFFSEIVRVF